MKDKTYTPDYISRPSDTIKESMEYSHVTVDDLWEEICLYDLAKLLADEIQIDERIAVALSKVLGSQPTFWMNLSNNYFAAKAGGGREMTKQEYMDKLNAAWFSGARCGKLKAATEIKDKYIASLEAENANLKADNRSLVEQMNKMAMRMEHKSGATQSRKS